MNVINIDKDKNNVPVRVYKNENGKYSVAISKKVGEEYVNRYFPVEFLKDVSVENKTDIIIKHAYMSWYDWEHEDKKGTTWLIKITAFDLANETQSDEVTPQNIDKWESAKSIEIEPDELPFY